MPHVIPLRILPLTLLAGSVAVAASAARGEAEGAGARVELELVGVLPMPEGSSSILVLREKGADRILPLIVPGGGDAAAPYHHGHRRGDALLGRAIEALGGRVAEVEIDRAEETRAGSRVRLAQGSKNLELRARPSETVPLAVAAGVPIVTRREVLDEAGITPDELAKAHARARGAEGLRL